MRSFVPGSKALRRGRTAARRAVLVVPEDPWVRGADVDPGVRPHVPDHALIVVERRATAVTENQPVRGVIDIHPLPDRRVIFRMHAGIDPGVFRNVLELFIPRGKDGRDILLILHGAKNPLGAGDANLYERPRRRTADEDVLFRLEKILQGRDRPASADRVESQYRVMPSEPVGMREGFYKRLHRGRESTFPEPFQSAVGHRGVGIPQPLGERRDRVGPAGVAQSHGRGIGAILVGARAVRVQGKYPGKLGDKSVPRDFRQTQNARHPREVGPVGIEF
jgi:hypothetical protein